MEDPIVSILVAQNTRTVYEAMTLSARVFQLEGELAAMTCDRDRWKAQVEYEKQQRIYEACGRSDDPD